MRFEGTVTGSLAHPTAAGHLRATNFAAGRATFNSLDADVTASPDSVNLRNASLASGAMQARFQAALGLDHWGTSPHSQIWGNATIEPCRYRGSRAADGRG